MCSENGTASSLNHDINNEFEICYNSNYIASCYLLYQDLKTVLEPQVHVTQTSHVVGSEITSVVGLRGSLHATSHITISTGADILGAHQFVLPRH